MLRHKNLSKLDRHGLVSCCNHIIGRLPCAWRECREWKQNWNLSVFWDIAMDKRRAQGIPFIRNVIKSAMWLPQNQCTWAWETSFNFMWSCCIPLDKSLTVYHVDFLIFTTDYKFQLKRSHALIKIQLLNTSISSMCLKSNWASTHLT